MADNQILGAPNPNSIDSLPTNSQGIPVIQITGTGNGAGSGNGSSGQSFVSNTNNSVLGAITGPSRDLGGVPGGAIPVPPAPADIVQTGNLDSQSSSNSGSSSGSSGSELRVTIQVPSDYVSGQYTSGSVNGELSALQAIIFPNTPQISIEHKATYNAISPTHSNYNINFYKNSSVEDISISGIFTVQNDVDAQVYLSTVFLLRALTKMRFSTDSDAGSPPPICRLNAYGQYMLANVPVGITSFKLDLPNDVDYYLNSSGAFGSHLVPTRCTITVNCKVMFSRAEMLSASVSSFLSGSGLGV